MAKKAKTRDRFICLLIGSCWLGFDFCESDAASIGRWIEGKRVLAEGGREVPSEIFAVLRLCVIGEGSDHKLARKRKVS